MCRIPRCMRLENKPELRRFFLKQRMEQPRAEKAAADRSISERLLASTVFARAQCVFCYVSTPDEIDTHGILRQALAEGKNVCVPRCLRAGEMRAYHIASLDSLRTGRFGILEPDASAREVPPERIDLIVAPALACDRAGYRQGYGGGYYDRFMIRTPAIRAALCAEGRLLERLPRTAFDQRCGWIFTERRVLHTDEKQ